MRSVIGLFIGIVVVSFFIATFGMIFITTLKALFQGPGGAQFRMIFSTVFWTLIIVVPIYKGVAWISGR